VLGYGGGFEVQLLGVGCQFYVYVVQDNHGGLGMLFAPAFRTGVALALGLNPGGFINFQADTIEDVAGWGGEIGVELVNVSVAAEFSIRDPFEFLWGLGGNGGGLGFGIGLYVALGYSFLWIWKRPGPAPAC
jgi:hypothetical protein